MRSLFAQGAKLGDRALELCDSRVHVFSLHTGVNFWGKRRHELSARFELALQLQGEGRSNAWRLGVLVLRSLFHVTRTQTQVCKGGGGTGKGARVRVSLSLCVRVVKMRQRDIGHRKRTRVRGGWAPPAAPARTPARTPAPTPPPRFDASKPLQAVGG